MDHQKAWESEFRTGNYNAFEKSRSLTVLLHQMDAQDRLGHLILDIGSGPITQGSEAFTLKAAKIKNSGIFYPLVGKKIIRIDYAAPKSVERKRNILTVKLDAHEIGTNSPQEREALEKINSFMRRTNGQSHAPFADAALLSDLLNYVNYRNVLQGLDHHVNPGGCIIINHSTGYGDDRRFHEKRPTSLKEIVKFMENAGYRLEHYASQLDDAQYPGIHERVESRIEGMRTMMVFRKPE